MTVAQMATLVGQEGLLRVERLQVQVRVVDVRTVYGRLQLLVEPVAGSGQQWVDADRVRMA